jgi:hypothetical protein
MQQHVHRYVVGAAGAGFVLVWTTLGLKTAVLAAVGALVAANWQRLAGIVQYRRPPRPVPHRQRPAIRARPLREEGDYELPLVPDEPSLVISTNGY